MNFVDTLLTYENLIIVAAVYGLLGIFSRVAPKVAMHAIYVRLIPLFPILLCSGAVWIPGAVSGTMVDGVMVAPTIAARIFLGVVLGLLAGQGHKIFKQTLLGKDARITNGKNRASLPPTQLGQG